MRSKIRIKNNIIFMMGLIKIQITSLKIYHKITSITQRELEQEYNIYNGT